ncbi:FAD:protein FMN transferase [Hyphomicrobium sp.]|uniref:FAD:protein FMN transferase n=1 Tax=Hyphomicrobium sp. TaxID=82 RepID=UPI0025C64764|nr:FAD:protein FMN transferase [Hyphomicrobium sp.]MCC7253586.1 FAD:protein FMN transferase [Hyphomicrobium sp.]
MSVKALAPAGADERRVLIPTRMAPPPFPGTLRTLIVKELGGDTMGTSWSAKVVVAPGSDLAPLKRGIEAVLARIIDEMSPWEPGSHISRFNAAPAGTWHRLPDGFFTVLSAALDWAERTQGAYDPTVGASVNLWGFGSEPSRDAVPDPHAVAHARARGGWYGVALDRERLSALQPGGLLLDLSSIAKGFAVDEVARHLRSQGIGNLLVEIGGELRAEGAKPDGSPWWVALERPRGAHNADALPETLLALTGLAVATSGDEQRYFDAAGRRYAHTLDPATGVPVTHDLVSVTVAAEDCMTADAAATALTVLGPERGPAFAAEHRLAARFVRLCGSRLTEHLSPTLAAMLD